MVRHARLRKNFGIISGCLQDFLCGIAQAVHLRMKRQISELSNGAGAMAKSKLCLTTIACLSIASSSTMVFAGSLMAEPVYFGARSVNPEKETYAYPGHVEKGERICFIGPARTVGPSTQDAEKDTVAYRTLLVGQQAGLRSAEPSQ